MAGETYVKRYPTGFTDNDNAKPVDDDFLNAVENALVRLLGEDPAQDELPVWTPGSSRFVFKKLVDANVDPTASLSPAKFSGYPNDVTKALLGDGSWGTIIGGGGVTSFPYSYNTGGEPPVGSQVRFDAGTPYTAVTKVWIAYTTNDGRNIKNQLLNLYGNGNRVYVQDKNDSTRYVYLDITGAPIDKGTYAEFPVVHRAHGVDLIAQAVEVSFLTPVATSSGGADLVYNGSFPTASPYTDGDIVISNGIAYMCVRPTSAAPTPWMGTRGAQAYYGASPPASPQDGDVWVLPADATNGVMWQFRYRAASASAYKWEFIGGADMYATVATNEGTATTATWLDLATVGPRVFVPRAGDYDVLGGAMQCVHSAASAITWAGIAKGATSPTGPSSAVGHPVAASVDAHISLSGQMLALAANDDVRLRYYNGTAGTANWVGRWLRVRPVRVA